MTSGVNIIIPPSNHYRASYSYAYPSHSGGGYDWENTIRSESFTFDTCIEPVFSLGSIIKSIVIKHKKTHHHR